VFAAIALLSGCLQYETIITVESDGSGRLEQIFLMNHEILAMLEGMASQSESGEGAEKEEFSLLDTEELEEQAQAMGEGVSLVSAEPMATDWGEGYVAVFEFRDISKLRVNQNPGEKVPDAGPSEGETQEENLTFEFERGNPSVLTVRFPSQEVEEQDEAEVGEAEMNTEGMDEMMRQFYTDMRILIALDIDGRIVSTNAGHRSGNRITLMDLDFNAILENPEATERLMNQQAQTIGDLQSLAAMVPGIQIETTDPVQVRFR
jgi:hypothetical protein